MRCSREAACADVEDRHSEPATTAWFAIAAGRSLFYLARLMGSSVEQIDRTYGHMLPESEHYPRSLLDDFDSLALDREAVQ
jgi:hypothetical protein